ncbi:MAG TPA: hypothetical protein VGN83_16490 [Falsiroseomonas sp.]|jgi:hypothetical protein|nr:hypothetical protein [Falsiroseomonas sp.]
MLVDPGLLRSRSTQRHSLIAPNLLRSLTLTRAQLPGVQAAVLGADGASWGLFDADTPRFGGTARRLVMEGQRINHLPNPRGEGIVPGTPGTTAAQWGAYSAPSGITRSILGTGREDGIDYVDVRYAGTATASGNIDLNALADAQQPAASAGQVWTFSSFARLIAGTLPEQLQIRIQERDSSNVNGSGSAAFVSITGVPLAAQRTSHTRTLSDAATAQIQVIRRIFIDSGVTVDCTIRHGWPQLEQGPFASAPILPPEGSPGASTRGADFVSVPLSSLGIGPEAACTLLWSGVFPVIPIGYTAIVLQVDNGSNATRWYFDSRAGDAMPRLVNSAGGLSNLSVPTAGVPLRLGLALDGTGRRAASMNGGAAVVQTGGPASGLSMLRLGGSATGGNNMWAETVTLRVLPTALSDADLQAAVAALPT